MSDTAANAHADATPTQSFHAVVDADAIQTTVSLAHALVEECHVHIDADGIRLPAMDPATVASVEATLDADAFDTFQATDARIGVNLARLDDILAIADTDQPVELALDQATRTLEITIGELEYTLALIDPDSIRSPPDTSEFGLDFTASLVADASDVHRAVTAASMVSNHVAFGVEPQECEFYAEADGDTDDVSLAIPEADLAEFSPGDAHSLFSIDYLETIDRAIPSNTDLSLELGDEHPIAIRFDYADGAGSVEYLVSPRISRQ
jgi:proliferating cell nuclear antigen